MINTPTKPLYVEEKSDNTVYTYLDPITGDFPYYVAPTAAAQPFLYCGICSRLQEGRLIYHPTGRDCIIIEEGRNLHFCPNCGVKLPGTKDQETTLRNVIGD